MLTCGELLSCKSIRSNELQVTITNHGLKFTPKYAPLKRGNFRVIFGSLIKVAENSQTYWLHNTFQLSKSVRETIATSTTSVSELLKVTTHINLTTDPLLLGYTFADFMKYNIYKMM